MNRIWEFLLDVREMCHTGILRAGRIGAGVGVVLAFPVFLVIEMIRTVVEAVLFTRDEIRRVSDEW